MLIGGFFGLLDAMMLACLLSKALQENRLANKAPDPEQNMQVCCLGRGVYEQYT